MFELRIDRRAKTSLQNQIESQLKRIIRQQHFSVEHPLPDPKTVATQINVDASILQAVYEKLEKQGFIMVEDGVYTSKVIQVHHIFFQKVFRLTDIFEINHLKASQKTLSIGNVTCPDPLLKENLSRDDPFIRYERLMYGNDKPFLKVLTYLPLKRYAFLNDLTLDAILYWEEIERRTGDRIVKVEQRIRFVHATKEDQSLFDDDSIELMNTIDIFFYNQHGELLDFTILAAPSHYLNIHIDFTINDQDPR